MRIVMCWPNLINGNCNVVVTKYFGRIIDQAGIPSNIYYAYLDCREGKRKRKIMQSEVL